jgi:hypothetical protein
LVNKAKKSDARSDAKSYSFGFELRAKWTLTGEKKQRILNICSCEGANKVNGSLPGLQFGAENNNSVAR